MWRLYLDGDFLGMYYSERNVQLAVLAFSRYWHRDPKAFVVVKVK